MSTHLGCGWTKAKPKTDQPTNNYRQIEHYLRELYAERVSFWLRVLRLCSCLKFYESWGNRKSSRWTKSNRCGKSKMKKKSVIGPRAQNYYTRFRRLSFNEFLYLRPSIFNIPAFHLPTRCKPCIRIIVASRLSTFLPIYLLLEPPRLLSFIFFVDVNCSTRNLYRITSTINN